MLELDKSMGKSTRRTNHRCEKAASHRRKTLKFLLPCERLQATCVGGVALSRPYKAARAYSQTPWLATPKVRSLVRPYKAARRHFSTLWREVVETLHTNDSTSSSAPPVHRTKDAFQGLGEKSKIGDRIISSLMSRESRITIRKWRGGNGHQQRRK
jgi:hypothetical protein